MIADFLAARRYFAPTGVSFWKWSGDGAALEWFDGTTIAFRTELTPILEELAPRGLPALDVVVMVLAARRVSRQPDSRPHVAADQPQFFQQVPQWWDGFDELLKFPQALALRRIVERALEDRPPGVSPTDSRQLLRAWSLGLPAEYLAPRSGAPLGTLGWMWEFNLLLQKLQEFEGRPSEDDLRPQTGLDQLVAPAPLEPVPPEAPVRAPRAWIASLQDDSELGGVARLARNLLAVTHLPRGLSDPDDLPLGGVSDITNRGPLDRLLLSELAHDDLTLTARVALHEALYLRREAPPRNPPRRRGILIETGIRTWGVPRVFATAVALSLAATTERDVSVAAFRPRGGAVEPADLLTRIGLIAQLAALETDPHPGAALEAFVAELGDDPGDAVLIVTEETEADPEFRRALSELQADGLYVAIVARDGRFELWSRSPRGSKRIRLARFALDELLRDPPSAAVPRAAVPLIDEQLAANLPAIFRVRPFPLRLPHPPDPQRVCQVGSHGQLSLTHDRRLMWWDQPQHGGLQLRDDLPRGPLRWAGFDRVSDTARLVIGGAGARQLVLLSVSLPGGEVTRAYLDLEGDSGGARGVCGHHGAVFVIRRRAVDVFSMETGARVESLVPQYEWQGGRFFLSDKQWFALGFDGQGARFEAVVSQPAECRTAPERQVMLVGLYEPMSNDGPWGVTQAGNLYSTTDHTLKRVSHALQSPVTLEAVSQTGAYLIIGGREASSPKTTYWQIETATGEASRWLGAARPTFVELEIEPPQQRNVRNRFSEIGVADEADGSRALVLSAKGGRMAIRLNGKHLVLQPALKGELLTSYRFQAMPAHGQTGYSLQEAVTHDGSRAVLDSRGLLHLKSSDPDLPELSLVLTEGALAGWCSDGRLFGAAYFIGKRWETPGSEVFESILVPFVQRLT